VQAAGQLAMLGLRMQDTLDTSPSGAKVAQSQAGLLLTRTVTWLQARVTLAQDTHKRCQRLLRQANRMLTATRAELCHAEPSSRVAASTVASSSSSKISPHRCGYKPCPPRQNLR